MKNLILLLLISIFISFSVSAQTQTAPPKAEVRNVTDEYFGVKVVDPYRWMEDLKSDETQKWMRGQADYADAYLKKLTMREAFVKRYFEVSTAGTNVRSVSENRRAVFLLQSRKRRSD